MWAAPIESAEKLAIDPPLLAAMICGLIVGYPPGEEVVFVTSDVTPPLLLTREYREFKAVSEPM